MAIDSADNSDARLPDDLRFLAEQLTEDSEHLVGTYPANAPQNWRKAFAAAVVQRAESPRTPPRKQPAAAAKPRSAVIGGFVAAAALALVALTWYAVDPSGSAATGGSSATVGRTQPESVITGEMFSLPNFGAQLFRKTTDPKPRFVLPPGAEPLEYLSPPEQEAFIDLIQQNQIAEPSLEF